MPPMPARRKSRRPPASGDRIPGLLHAWYLAHRRSMPWRADPPEQANPYHVLFSELMLQQTQVVTVIPYFRRFIDELPTLEHLARASEQTVLRLWQGLGYYSRARNLHRAAQLVAQERNGRIPDDPEDLKTLPGIGPYTAGAIASIAYGRPAPLVDGNVARVLIRLAAERSPATDPAVRKYLWTEARRLVESAHARHIWPGDFNQALMELGATVCTPAHPACPQCPLRDLCESHRMGLAHELPVAAPRAAPRKVRAHIVALSRRGKLLFRRRPDQGLWAGLWEMPSFDRVPASRLGEEVKESLGLRMGPAEKVGRFTHITSHRRFELTLWRAAALAGRLKPAEASWENPDKLDHLPLAALQRRALRMLQSAP